MTGHPLPTPAGRCVILGVVNVTPDSFSDGGEWFEPEAAIAHGRALVAAGADVVDVGGESTRPGAERPSLDEELRRVLPVVQTLAADGAVVSIDTMRASVAEAALGAGAALVNDVSGGLADPQLVEVVVAARCPMIAMHWRGHSAGMQRLAVYDDVTADVCAELAARRDALLEAGVIEDRLVLDPGLGFAKNAEHNWALLAHLDALVELGQPLMVGASRKAFLGRVGVPEGAPSRTPQDRENATTATSVIAAQAGVWGLRVHDVAGTASAIAVVDLVEAHR